MKLWMITGYIGWAFSTWFGLLHQQKYSKAWDDELNRLMDTYWDKGELRNYKFNGPSYHTILLDDVQVWVSNKYFSYGHRYGTYNTTYVERRPSVKTMIKLNRYVKWLEENNRYKYGWGE